MNAVERTNGDYLSEMATLLDRFCKILKIENAAIERRDTSVLHSLANDKADTGKRIETLWGEFRPRLAVAGDADRNRFLDLNRQLNDLQPLIAQNMKLLNAAKVTTANRIEAGVKAWQRARRDHAVEYGSDGRVSDGGSWGAAKPDRLI